MTITEKAFGIRICRIVRILYDEVLANSGKIGPIFENFCLNEIRKAMSLTAPFSEFHFWRTTGGAEVDFVIKTESRVIPG